MTTNYDAIAEQYRQAKFHPWRAHVEAFTFLETIGPLQGKRVLDVACGEGFYSRLFRAQGAASVTGVDLSSGMIALANQQEEARPQGIRYVAGDAREMDFDGEFDLVCAAYLLNYARTREELQSMLHGIARALKPGGRFVTVNSNPKCDFPNAPSFRKYSFETKVLGPWMDGAPIQWVFHLDANSIKVENYFLDAAAHEEACARAGLNEVRWHPPRLAPEGRSNFPENYWNDLLNAAPIICLECARGAAAAGKEKRQDKKLKTNF